MGPTKISAAVRGLLVCQGCPVREPCAEYADATGSRSGVWGGKFWSGKSGKPAAERTVSEALRKYLEGVEEDDE